jgi:DNA polymerase-3 subunit epsilon
MDIDNALNTVESSEDFVVLKKLPDIKLFNSGKPSGELSKVMILDTETTGLNYKKDEIIELGYVIIEFDENLSFFNVVKSVDLFNEPRNSISEKITGLTGLRDEDVKGHSIDWNEVASDLEDINLVVAHNSGFDRKFVEKYCDSFKNVPWACSLSQVDWENIAGVNARNQEFLAFKFGGFFYDAHRATDDVQALAYLLSIEYESGKTVFSNLIESFNKKHYLIKAVGAVFAFRDELREKGYSWNANEKVWQKLVSEPADKEEILWLMGAGVNNPVVKEVSNLDMFSDRI